MSEAARRLTNLHDQLHSGRQSAAKSQRATSEAQSVVQYLPSWLETLRKHRHEFTLGSPAWGGYLDESRRLRESYTKLFGDIERLRDQVQQLALDVGMGPLHQVYSDEAKKHAESAARWLRAIIGFVLLTAVAGVLLLTLGNDLFPSGDDAATIVASTASRVVIIGAVAYLVAVSVRSYRSHAHLQAVYELRAGALSTFAALSEVLSDDTTGRGIVLTELAKAVFASAETGMTAAGGETTIIENTLPYLSGPGRAAGG